MERETDIAMVERHIRQGEDVVARQEALVARLRQGGHNVDLAEAMLEQFRTTLAEHQLHLDRLLAP